jgi:hypothetical protein
MVMYLACYNYIIKDSFLLGLTFEVARLALFLMFDLLLREDIFDYFIAFFLYAMCFS